MKYSLGLDIGVASVGWAVIDEDKRRIEDLGVRIFEKAEDPQDGSSLAAPRREARSLRRRIKRRRQRLNFVKDFFVEQGLLSKEQIDNLLNIYDHAEQNTPYALRAKGLDEKLSSEELFRAIYHIAKRRGFKSNRKSEEKKDRESGAVLASIGANETLLANKNYRTVGEALHKDESYQLRKRNGDGAYFASFARADFENELRLLLQKQRDFGLKISDEAVERLLGLIEEDPDGAKRYYGIFAQRPFMTSELIEKMIGECTFEKGEKRAPRGSYSFEKFRLLQSLVHIRILDTGTGELRNLAPNEIQAILQKAHEQKSISYATVRKAIGMSDDEQFETIKGAKQQKKQVEKGVTLETEETRAEQEKTKIDSFKAYHALKDALKELSDDWEAANNAETLDVISYALTVNKSDEDIEKALRDLPMKLSSEAITALLNVPSTHFKAFGHLSFKALGNIMPHLEQGNTYDKAAELAGYDFRAHKKGDSYKLPSLNAEAAEQITNPVVKRAISQSIKVINAVINRYGSPHAIKLECSRDLAKSFRDRQDIKRTQDENEATNKAIIAHIEELGFTTPNGQQITKYKLYKQQGGKCLYSGENIDIVQMLKDDNLYQIDHIIPFSRCGIDGLNNKVLVKTSENQIKGNKLPREAFGENEAKWNAFEALAGATQTLPKPKKNNLLLKQYKADSWNERAINDTRYISRFLTKYIKQNLRFAEGEGKQRVIAPNGMLTAYIRKRWGLTKIREENVLHHAADAALVATVTQGLIARVNLYAKKGEIEDYLHQVKTMEEKTDKLTGEILDEAGFSEADQQRIAHDVLTSKHFPQPWEDFSKELRKRLLDKSATEILNELRGIKSYDEDEEFHLNIKPVFVSRMPNRKASGQAHQETLRSPKADENSMRTVRAPLSSVKLKDLNNSPVKDTDPQLYKTLRERLEAHGDNPEKAFAEPVYKKDKHGNNASQIRAIKVASKQPSGFYVNDRQAFVNNGSMVRLDVYQKANKKGKLEHFFVPVYTHQAAGGAAPTKILPQPKGFTDVDETFTKVTTLFPNDYVRVYLNNAIKEGYYVSYNTNNGSFMVMRHLAPDKTKDNLVQVSARSAVSIERFDVSVLGDNVPRV